MIAPRTRGIECTIRVVDRGRQQDRRGTSREVRQPLAVHLVQQPMRAYGPSALEELQKKFASNVFNIRRLAVDVMVTSALTPRDK